MASALSYAQRKPECQQCHGVRGFSIKASDGNVVSLYVDTRRFKNCLHGSLQCSQCHTNMTEHPKTSVSAYVPGSIAPYVAKWRPETRPSAAACVTCHPGVFDAYSQSIHATALRRGNRSSPYCVDCHGSHYICRGDLESAVDPQNVPATCASCHAVGVLMSRHDISTDTYTTFRQSVHGRRLALGQTDVAVCTSCHGVHDIRSPKDLKSTISPQNIVNTCRECHKGASRQFALSFRHAEPSPTVDPAVYWVQVVYRIIIIVTIGGMIGYIILDLFRRLVLRVRRGRRVR